MNTCIEEEKNEVQDDLHLVFLGTVSMKPAQYRGASAILV